MPRWLLPEHIADVLPAEARAIEELRRRLLDLYRSYGYELVMPPLIEHIESLLTGSGHDLDLRTFKLIDQLSGRTLGLRPDMTTQVARIDAHLLDRRGVVRLCYCGPVLHARPSGLYASREPLQLGAEIYGHAGPEADLEMVELMAASLQACGVGRVRLDLCHAALVPALLAMNTVAAREQVDEDDLFTLLQHKDTPGLRKLLAPLAADSREALLALPALYGVLAAGEGRASGAAAKAGAHAHPRAEDAAPDCLARARAVLPPLPAISAALDDIRRLVESPLWARHSQVELSADLADLRGYRYHSGLTVAAYVDGRPDAVARGGRYDDVGRAFGRARPATGFSLELRELAGLQPAPALPGAILAPWSDDPQLAQVVAQLRAAGQIVVRALPGHEPEQQEFACDRELVQHAGAWAVRAL
ncbi:MAG: ATP phosphoribosyltransferase regulatory subunit [Betaproteobacteria bacterium]|nr:ATP phosphoribosyltransferase regulatory subunit [Betaproteobacteria bacterium]